MLGPVWKPRGGDFTKQIDMIPYYNFNRQISFNGFSNVNAASNYFTNSPVGVFNSPQSGFLCSPNGTSCGSLNSTGALPSSGISNQFPFRFNPDRASCGTTITFNGAVYFQGLATTNLIEVMVNVGNLTGKLFIFKIDKHFKSF